MFWTAVLVLLALDLSQVPAELVSPGVKENAITEESFGSNSADAAQVVTAWGVQRHHPHVAMLRGVEAPGFIQYNCAGSVVHRNWVLTAARCTARRVSLIVRVGVNDFNTVPDYIFETLEWWVHPRFDIQFPSSAQANDISIVRVERAFTYSELVQPIRVQPSADAFTEYENHVLIYTGLRWTNGDTPEVLNSAYFLGITNVDCMRRVGWTLLTQTSVCAIWYNVTSQSSCPSSQIHGGPLWHIDGDGAPVLAGINSVWQNNLCNDATRIAVFVRPGAYHTWLTEITGLDFDNLDEEDEVTEAPLTTKVTEPPNTTESTPEPETTVGTVSITNETTEPPVTEPLATETNEPLTTEEIESTTTGPAESPSTGPPLPPVTTTEPETEESTEDSNDSDSSESEEGPVISQLLNKLQVKVKVKVKVSNDVN